ncbi:hypothetical protein NLG97_g1234 [Lecanicillium saksenae]|uniref:Uncharacterized protein n=1 Tax=Lecanicillium saksenae TaxID=468837 RepID=A0ACC1R621_9HYPO|nr:hypothetical protein NLG97_g1234 [Lecanicillium saksenae]
MADFKDVPGNSHGRGCGRHMSERAAQPVVTLQPSGAAPGPATSTELAMSGYFRTQCATWSFDEFNHGLWMHLLPQTMHSIPPIWHACNAVGGVSWSTGSETNMDNAVAERLRKESIRQYSLSVDLILKLTSCSVLSVEEQTVILTGNVLLSSYSLYLPGRSYISIASLSCRLIRSWKFWEYVGSKPMSPLIMEVLYFFVKTEDILRDALFITPQERGETWYEALYWLQQRPLESLMAAHVEIDMIWSSLHVLSSGLNHQSTKSEIESAYSQRSAFYQQFLAWETRFDALLSSSSATNKLRSTALKVRQTLVFILLNVDHVTPDGTWNEVGWDAFHALFGKALGLIESMLSLDESGSNLNAGQVGFSPSLWKSLNFISRACRSPTLRRRAADLLRLSIRSQGGANDLVVDKVIEVEEKVWNDRRLEVECEANSTCVPGKFICNLHRVARVHAEHTDSLLTHFTFATMADILNNRPGERASLQASIFS